MPMNLGLGLGLSRRAVASGGGGNVAPVITGVPTISGTATVGNVLTASPASVTGTPSPTRTWQWYRDGVARAGETSTTYTIVSGDQGVEITVEQIETNIAGSDTATSLGEAIPYLPIDPLTLVPTAWFAPNEAGTVWQETNGSVASTAGQPVGLIHDIAQSMALGSNLVTNPGPFSATTDWTGQRGAALSVVSSKLRVAGTGTSFTYGETPCATTLGRYYLIEGNAAFVSGSDNNCRFETSDQSGTNLNVKASDNAAARSIRFFIQATANGIPTRLRLVSSDGNDVYDWDNLSFREMSGIPALQATAGNRPILGENGSGVKYLENVSSDTLNWAAPAGTYTVAYVVPDGTVTILTGQSLSGSTNIMLASQIVEYIAIPGSLTTAQEGGLTAYLEGVANP